MKLYVGNLSFETTENDLQDLFEQHGKVTDVALMMDRTTGRSRGFAFVSFADSNEANAAIAAINGKEVDRKSTRLNSSHLVISYAVFCLKKNSNQVAATNPCGEQTLAPYS